MRLMKLIWVKNVGMAFENYEDIRADDVIEVFERQEIERKLA